MKLSWDKLIIPAGIIIMVILYLWVYGWDLRCLIAECRLLK